MNIEFFLKCEHDIEINTSMTRLYCTKCGQDKNVIDYIEELKSLIKEAIPWIENLDKNTTMEDIRMYPWIRPFVATQKAWLEKAEKIK